MSVAPNIDARTALPCVQSSRAINDRSGLAGRRASSELLHGTSRVPWTGTSFMYRSVQYSGPISSTNG